MRHYRIALLALLVGWAAVPFTRAADRYDSMKVWTERAFMGRQTKPQLAPAGLEIRRQDHGLFGLRRSSRNTAPLKLGNKTYAHGLGTHSESEIAVRLDRPGKTFLAEIGIDNNWDTQGQRGSVVFVVEAGEKMLFRSKLRRGSDGPQTIEVPLHGTREFVLRVLDGGDGRSHDQADWANASVVFEDGHRLYLDDLPPLRSILAEQIPFSFRYGGKTSASLLAGWKRSERAAEEQEGRRRRTIVWTDPQTGLEIACRLTEFTGFPAVEWVLDLTNTGSRDTPLLEAIRPLDVRTAITPDCPMTLHYANGSTCDPEDFRPLAQPMESGKETVLAPQGGRSSNGRLPFFNLDAGSEGILIGIGWSGQWQLRASRQQDGRVHLEAGQETTRFVLRPKEKVRTPSILLVGWSGERMVGHNQMRRLIYRHYTPRLDGKPPLPPVQCNSWFPVGDDGGKANERNQIELLEAYAKLGIEYLVMDAGWYGATPNWAENVGSWTPRKDTFPNGLRPVGAAAQKAGIQFGLWFEPERVCPGTVLDREHPRWLLRTEESAPRLLNLGMPEAQEWFVELVSRYIREVPLGYFRHDFNMDPLPYWRLADAPDRQGITEIRYVEGLYRVWDELMRRHPRVLFEGCASGGRRIDLESIRRCHTYWRSDLYFQPLADRGFIHGASLYLPGNYLNTPLLDCSETPYHFRGTLGGALCLAWDPRAERFPVDRAKARIAEFKSLRHFAVGDFYPLLPHTVSANDWIAYQLDRPDLDAGVVLAFRGTESRYAAVDVSLSGLKPDATYELNRQDSGQTQRLCGKTLMDSLWISIQDRPGSAIYSYRRIATPESPDTKE